MSLPPALVPFRVTISFEVTDAKLTTDSAKDTKPTRLIGLSNEDRGGAYFFNGILTTVGIRLNPANAVTYDFEVYQGADGADSSYRLRSDRIFSSEDNHDLDVAACADDTVYEWDIWVPFKLDDPGDFYFNIDWSAAPGNTTGYIFLAGWREV